MICRYRDAPQAMSIWRGAPLSILDGQLEDLDQSSKPFRNDHSGVYEQCHQGSDGHGPSFLPHCLHHWHLLSFGWILRLCGWPNTGDLYFMTHKLN